MGLEEYRRRRDFAKTPEPEAGEGPGRQGPLYIIQKHAARRLHYDFRLELDGVLKSWAVTKGPSLDPADKRLAVQTEDHPLDYGDFEGVIPKGEYGGGTVMLWDRGCWEPVGDPREGLAKGVLKFRLHGEKLQGGWALVRLKPRSKKDAEGKAGWLLVKERDDQASESEDPLAEDRSVKSGRSMDQIAEQRDAVWSSREPWPDARPQLASLAEEAPEGEGWLHEIKLDGYRIMARLEDGRATLFTRNGHDWTPRFRRLAQAVEGLPCRSALLDGEAVVFDASGASRFGALQEALSEGASGAMHYVLFDLLYLDGGDLTGLPLTERKERLARLLHGQPDPLRLSDHIQGRGPEVRTKACSFALEGVVSKRGDRPYRAGRGKDWLKAKCTARQEFVVVGSTPPQGARSGIGALLVAVNGADGLVYAGKVGTGFSERVLADLDQRLSGLAADAPPVLNPPREKAVRWVQPRLVAEVEFTEWTREGQLRHPSFKGLRLDKAPSEVVREAEPAAQGQAGLDQRLAEFRLTSPAKVLWPGQGITKRGLAAYYLQVADWVLPHLIDRPLSLVRCPQGSARKCFYQRHKLGGMPDSVRALALPDDPEPMMTVQDLDGLMALVQFGVLEIHVWGCRAPALRQPDRLVFDLDPDPDLPWDRVAEGAVEVRDRLSALGLVSFLKTTGGKGLHVVAPITPGPDWDQAKAWTKAFAERLSADRPDRYVAVMTKARRKGRIYLDYLRNQYTATAVAPYSTRARDGAPVSVPLHWEELGSGLRSDHFTVETLPRRLASLDRDPWAGMAQLAQALPGEP